jgi:hypothetical protein
VKPVSIEESDKDKYSRVKTLNDNKTNILIRYAENLIQGVLF